MRTRPPLVALWAIAALAACSFDAVNFTLSNVPGDGPLTENCDTPGDEDGNGLADCSDPACAAAPACQPRCGNGKPEAGEECDDGNTTNGDTCENDCTLPKCGNSIVDVSLGEVCDPPTPGTCGPDCRSLLACGNGVIDPGEECDNGLSNNGDDNDCRSDCVINRCGDGRANTKGTHHEDCDAGPRTADHIRTAIPKEGAGCNIDCTVERCGDGKINKTAGEQCDDSNASNGDGCSATCKLEFCGDGIVNNGEACDRALTPATCNLDCTLSRCGDGKLNTSAIPPETCDDGNALSGDGCSSVCRLEHCGNGVVDTGEECDGLAGLQPCSATCHQQRCGNGILDPGEQCDDGNVNDGDGCSRACKLEFCGDGIVNNGENCDRALTPATCNLDCTLSRCGDGKLNTFAVPPETCDDGNQTSGDGCSSVCRLEHCGNGVVDTGEDCDGLAGPQPCSATCHHEVCGNGILDPGEQCDDGNTTAGDGCSSTCRLEHCGNGVVDAGEECDGLAGLQPCSATCRQERCGNGILDPGEQCDDGNALACGSCSADCRTATSNAATGAIFPALGSTYVANDNFTLSDGSVTVTFQFTTGGPPATGRVAIVFTATDSVPTMASHITNAVAANLSIGAQAVNGVVLLQNRRLTSRGNVAITEAVNPAGFVVFGMSGGQGGDCSTSTGCTSDSDCASQVCAVGRCQ